MKLLYCPDCKDFVTLVGWEKLCKCGASYGRYVGGKTAIVSKDAIVLGVPNQAIFIHGGGDVFYEDGTDYQAVGVKHKLQYIVRLRRNGGEGELVFVKTFKSLKSLLRFYEVSVP